MLDYLFKPHSVAVIGASRKPGKVGYEVLSNIIKSGFQGEIHPVNPNATEIQGLPCFPSVLEIETEIDLGILAVPAQIVPEVAKEAGVKGIKYLIIISSGFKESGREGARIEKEVMTICHQNKIRVLGPNCLGIIDTYTPLNASFAATLPPKGNIALISQSGALGTAILDWSLKERIGFSKFVSLGNRADINESDLIQGLMEDDLTKVILIYIEGLDNGRRFIEVAEEVTPRKPIIILKSGITSAGVRAVTSHTGAMAGMDLAYDVAFDHANIIRVSTIGELFNFAKAFSTQPYPQGPNIAIVTNAGGPGIIATDACEKHGLSIAPIPATTVKSLHQVLPSAAGFFNPIDVLGDASAKRYKFALETILQVEEVNSSLIILTPQAMTEPSETAQAIVTLRKKYGHKPMVASFLGGRRVIKAIETLETAEIPNFEFPEDAIQALAALYTYAQQRGSSSSRITPRFDVDVKKVTSILTKVVDDRRVILRAFEATEIINAYGISTPPLYFAATAEEAVSQAELIGYPVVMKIESPQILHKTDIGGVKLNIQSPVEVRTSFYELIGRAHTYYPRASIAGVNIQKMISPGKELIVGMTHDLTFGPLLMFGLGGIYVNLLEDVSFRLAPLSRQRAEEMIQETKAFTLLRGIRGEAASDVESVVDVMLRVSQLVTDFMKIRELDINPLIVYEKGKGSYALDVKITIKP